MTNDGAPVNITGNNFIGVQYDPAALAAIEAVAAAFQANAIGLSRLAEALAGGQVKIETMLKV